MEETVNQLRNENKLAYDQIARLTARLERFESQGHK